MWILKFSADDIETARCLEERGAHLEETDNEGLTALQIAEKNEQTEMVNYIKGRDYIDQAKVRFIIMQHEQ